MAHRLDIVPIRIEHEGSVVVRVVLRPEPRRAVVHASRLERRPVKRVDSGARLRDEGDVQRALQGGARANPEIRLAIGPQAGMAAADRR